MNNDDPKSLLPGVASPPPTTTNYLSINKIKSSLVFCIMFYIPRFSKLLCNSGLGPHHTDTVTMMVTLCHSSSWWSPCQLFKGIGIYTMEFLICKKKAFCSSELPLYLSPPLWGLEEFGHVYWCGLKEWIGKTSSSCRKALRPHKIPKNISERRYKGACHSQAFSLSGLQILLYWFFFLEGGQICVSVIGCTHSFVLQSILDSKKKKKVEFLTIPMPD